MSFPYLSRRLGAALLLLGVTLQGEIITTDRRVDWENEAGIAGGIPSNITTVFASVTSAPYSADSTGATDASGAINAAIAACPANQIVSIPAGIFKISNPIELKSNVILRGAGMTNTVLRFAGSFEYGVRFFNPADFELDQAISAGLTKGSTLLTLANASSYQVGYEVLLDQNNDTSIVNAAGTEGPGLATGVREYRSRRWPILRDHCQDRQPNHN